MIFDEGIIQSKTLTRVMYAKYLFAKTAHMFKYTGLPTSLPAEEIEHLLQFEGQGIVTEHEGEPYIYKANPTGLADVYGNHQHFLVTNTPHKKMGEKVTNGIDCVHFKNDSQCLGLWYPVARYTEFLAEADITIKNALINARTPYVLVANDEKEEKSIKKFYKKIEKGENAVIVQNSMIQRQPVDTKEFGDSNAGGTILNILDAEKTIEARFFSELGVNLNDTNKSQYVNSDDLEYQNHATMHFIENMLYQRKKAIERINIMFDLEIEVEINELWVGISPTQENNDGDENDNNFNNDNNNDNDNMLDTNESDTIIDNNNDDDMGGSTDTNDNIEGTYEEEQVKTEEDLVDESEGLDAIDQPLEEKNKEDDEDELE